MNYYILINGQQTGPLTLDQLRNYTIRPDTRVWREDLPNWIEARELDELKVLWTQTPPPFGQGTSSYTPPSPESRATGNFDAFAFLAKLDKDYQWMIGSIITLFGGLFLCLIAGIWSAADDGWSDRHGSSVLFLVIAMLVFLAGIVLSIVFFCKVQYAFWTIVQDGTQKPKPGEAVGFLFIPFFNLYWIFVSFNRLSKELNKVADERDPGGYPRADEGVSLAYCILYLCAIIPILGYLAILGRLVLFFIMMANHKKTVHRIANAGALSF